jgi:hypothetical protein
MESDTLRLEKSPVDLLELARAVGGHFEREIICRNVIGSPAFGAKPAAFFR